MYLKGRHRPGAGVYFSLAEYAYVILFIAIIVATVLFAENQRLQRDIEGLATLNGELASEVEKLEAQLAESKQREAQLPCDAIAASAVPAVLGTVTIESATAYHIQNHGSNQQKRAENISESLAMALLDNDVRQLFGEEVRYAAEHECFVRIRLLNKTNDFALYLRYKSVLRNAGIAVVLD